MNSIAQYKVILTPFGEAREITVFDWLKLFFKTMSNFKKLAKTIQKLQSGTWEDHWIHNNLTWDAGKSSPALLNIINELPKGKWLVPGCGYGYDVLELYKQGNKVIGLDYAPTCIEKCLEKYKMEINDKMQFICEDFFKHKGIYDGVYDYTFFAALELNMRKDWGLKMGEIIKKNGILITLMFPIDDHAGGPPFAVQPDHYQDVLVDFNLISLENCESFKPRQNREKLGIWSRK
eukprot:NODE_1240_length_1659_cov_0.387179.p2 type:complete len:234 gc:universal NODE_1240_length_1659_cov_0.387179:779-1480(+)